MELDPDVAPCLGTYGDPRGVGVSYERGTPVQVNSRWSWTRSSNIFFACSLFV